MSRWIDADALKERYKEVQFKTGMTERIVRWLVEVNIDKAQSIDIVKCKECGAYMTDGYADGCGFCGFHHSVVKASDFCSYGEPKAK